MKNHLFVIGVLSSIVAGFIVYGLIENKNSKVQDDGYKSSYQIKSERLNLMTSLQ